MKLSHKLCGAALVAAAGIALVVPNTTKAADPDPKTGTGHIAFTSDTSDIVITDPGSTDGTTIYPSDPVNPGEFGMIVVTPLEFDSHSVVGAQTKKEYDVLEYEVATDAGTKKMQHFVGFQDFRAQEKHAYQLSANISKPFQTTDGLVLKGAKLTYDGIWLANEILETPADMFPTLGGTTQTLESAMAADTAGASVTFINNEDADSKGIGYGRYTLNFGEDVETATTEAIKLDVAPSGNIMKGDYTAVITWTLASV